MPLYIYGGICFFLNVNLNYYNIIIKKVKTNEASALEKNDKLCYNIKCRNVNGFGNR